MTLFLTVALIYAALVVLAFVSQTKMIFPGIKDEAKRKDIIAYLEQFDESGKKKD